MSAVLKPSFVPSEFTDLLRDFVSGKNKGEPVARYFYETGRNVQEVLICVFDRLKREPKEEVKIVNLLAPHFNADEKKAFVRFFFDDRKRNPPHHTVMESFLATLGHGELSSIVGKEVMERIFSYLFTHRTAGDQESVTEALLETLSYEYLLGFVRFISDRCQRERVPQRVVVVTLEKVTSHPEYKKGDVNAFCFLETFSKERAYLTLVDLIHTLLIDLDRDESLALLPAKDIVVRMKAAKEKSKISLDDDQVRSVLWWVSLAKASGFLPEVRRQEILRKKFHLLSFILTNHSEAIEAVDVATELCMSTGYPQPFVMLSGLLVSREQFSQVFRLIPKQHLVPKVTPWYQVFLQYEPCLQAMNRLPSNQVSLLLGELGVRHEDFWKYKRG